MEKVCRKCGNYVNKENASYCPGCGCQMIELKEDRKGYSINVNGWFYFAANTVILLFLTLGRGRIQGLEFIFLILGILLQWCLLVREKNRIFSVSRKLPVIVFLDALIVFVSFSDVWRPLMTGNVLDQMMNHFEKWIVLAFLGIVCYVISVRKKSIAFQWIAFELFGLVFTFFWGWSLNYWSGYIKIFFLIYTILNLVWCLVIKTGITVESEKMVQKRWMSFGLLAVLVFLRFYCGGAIEGYLMGFPDRLSLFLHFNLGTGKMIVLLIILFVFALIMGVGEVKRCGCDALVMCGIACAVILLKATTVFYIPGGFLAFFVYGFIFIHLLQKEMRGAFRFSINRGILLTGITVGMVISLFLISIGLWMLVVVGLIFTRILTPKPGQAFRKNFVPILMIGMILEAVLAIVQFKLHPEAYLAVAVVSITFFVMLRLLTWKHPSVGINRKKVKTGMCAAFGLFMILIVFKNGTAIDVAYNPSANQITVNAEARGKDNFVTAMGYYWTENPLFAETTLLENRISAFEKEISTNIGAPAGRCLVIHTTDANGVSTSKRVFIPAFYYTLSGM